MLLEFCRDVALTPAAKSAKRLGIYGGSFDPPHRCHLEVARRAAAEFALDHVLFVPAARPPHKPERVLASEADRVAMLELLVVYDGDISSVWTGELQREGPSYSVVTVSDLAAQTDAELFWILGSDNLPGLRGWYRVEDLLQAVRPIVHVRRGDELDLADLYGLSKSSLQRVVDGYLEVEPCDASSTGIRESLGRSESIADALPPRLVEYIEIRGLYRSE